jgi:hypothetical protein
LRRKPRKYEECHKEIDGVMYKLCNKCEDWHPLNEEYFYKNNKSLDGFNPYCKNYMLNRYLANRDEFDKKRLEHARKHPEQNRESVRKYRKKNLNKVSTRQKEWRQNNPDRIREYNKDRTMNKKHEITDQEWFDCLDFFNNSCAYCGLTEQKQIELFGEQFHKEHVIHNGSNYIDNCVPSCTSCNTSKHDSEFNEWYNKNNPNFTQKRLNKIIKWMTEECFNTLNLI